MRVGQLRQAIALAHAGCQLTEAARLTGLTIGQLQAIERRDNVRFARRLRYYHERAEYEGAAEAVRGMITRLQQVTQRA